MIKIRDRASIEIRLYMEGGTLYEQWTAGKEEPNPHDSMLVSMDCGDIKCSYVIQRKKLDPIINQLFGQP